MVQIVVIQIVPVEAVLSRTAPLPTCSPDFVRGASRAALQRNIQWARMEACE